MRTPVIIGAAMLALASCQERELGAAGQQTSDGPEPSAAAEQDRGPSTLQQAADAKAQEIERGAEAQAEAQDLPVEDGAAAAGGSR